MEGDFLFADCCIGEALQFRPDPEVHIPVSAGLQYILNRLKHLQSPSHIHLRPNLPQQHRQDPPPHLHRTLTHIILIIRNQLPEQSCYRWKVSQLAQPFQGLGVGLEILQKCVEFFADEDHEALGYVI